MELVGNLANKRFVITVEWEVNAEELVGLNLQDELNDIGGYAEIVKIEMFDEKPMPKKPVANTWGKNGRSVPDGKTAKMP